MCSLFLVSSMLESRSAVKTVTKENYRVRHLTTWEVPVKEHILLLGAACFALGGEELAQHLVQPLLEQVTFDTNKAQFRSQLFSLRKCRLQLLFEGREFFDCGLQRHCSFRSNCFSKSSISPHYKRSFFAIFFRPIFDTKQRRGHASPQGQFRRAASAVAEP